MIIDSLNPKKEKKVKRKKTRNIEIQKQSIIQCVENKEREKKKININIISEKELDGNDQSNTIEQDNFRKSKNVF
jgi:hypothetical protein